LAEVLSGMRGATRGAVYVGGKEVTSVSPSGRMTAGMAAIPEERMKEGVVRDMWVSENIILRDHHKAPYSRNSFLDFKAIAREGKRMVESFRVKTPSLGTPIKNLSGGNIQKVILARELDRKPSVLVASQPTRGVDIGASEYIHQRILEQRALGTATLLISEDLDEVRALSDRIAVMFEGNIVGVVDAKTATLEELGLMMAGALSLRDKLTC
jgi:simple sugar transport system ATP-binding protein